MHHSLLNNNVKHILFTQYHKITTSKFNLVTIPKRFMLSAACASGSRASYHLLKIITNHANKIYTDDTTKLKDFYDTLSRELTDYSLNNNRGIMPHKSVIMRHVLAGNNHSSEIVYNEYKNKTGYNNVSTVSANTDTRIYAELSTLEKFQNMFGKDIIHVQATIDSKAIIPADLKGLRQPNPDWRTTIATKWRDYKILDYRKEKIIYNDQKSGTNMFSHSTSGNLGIVYYDENLQPILFLNNPLPLENLIKYDHTHLEHLFQAMKADNLYKLFGSLKLQAQAILNDDTLSLMEKHNKYNAFSWEHIQCHPLYNRGISMVFIETVNFTQDSSIQRFHQEFLRLAGNKIYNLDRRGDCRVVTHAMITAYANTVDKDIVAKLTHLNKSNQIVFNRKFLEDLALLLKKNVYYT